MLKLVKKCKWLTPLAAIIAMLMMVGVTAVPVHADGPPAIPCNYYGYAYIDGVQAINGKTVSAYINGVLKNSTTTSSTAGRNFSLTVAGGSDGDTVTFYVDGVLASPTSVYTAGGFTFINLYTYTTTLGVTTQAATGVGSTTATLNGNLTGLGASPSVNVSFEYGLTTSYGSTTTPQSKTTTGTFTAGLTGLTPATTYHCRAKATDGATTVYGSDVSFTTTTPVLAVSTGAASGVTTSTATLTGTLTDMGLNSNVNVCFEWGTTTAYGNTTSTQSKTSTGAFSAVLSGLASGTTYHFRSKAVGSTTAYGSDMTFTTSAQSGGCSSGCCHWLWGTAYLNGSAVSGGTVAAIVNGSQAATTTTNSAGGYNFYVPVTAGSTITFTVSGVAAGESLTGACMGYNGSYNLYATSGTVAVSTTSGSYASASTATMLGNLNSLGTDTSATVSFEYGTTTGYGSTSATQSMGTTGSFTSTLTGLTAGQTYHARAKAVGSPSGTIVYGSDVSWLQSPGGSLAVSSTSGTGTSTTQASLVGNVTSLGTDTSATVSFEYGTTVAYGSTTATQSVATTGAYTSTATGLTAGQTYHGRAKAVGSPSGTTVYGSDITWTQPASGTLAVASTSGAYLTDPTATLNGNLTGLGADTSATVSFEFGTTAAYGSTTATQSVAATGAFSSTATGLTAGQTYHMRAKAVGSPSGTTVYGTDVTWIQTSGACGSDPLGCTVGEMGAKAGRYSLIVGRFLATSTTSITQLNVLVNNEGGVKAAIYSDNAGSIGTKLAGNETLYTGTAENVVSIPIASTAITSGTYYWIAAWSNTASCIGMVSTASTGTTRYQETTSTYTFPATMSGYFDSYTFRALLSGS